MNTASLIAPSQPVAWQHGGVSNWWDAQPRLAATSAIPELIQRDHQRELERIAGGSEDARSAEYAMYVILPLFLLVGIMIALRKMLPF